MAESCKVTVAVKWCLLLNQADVVPAKHKMQKGKMVPYGYEVLRWKASKGPVWVGHIFKKSYVGLKSSHTLTEERGVWGCCETHMLCQCVLILTWNCLQIMRPSSPLRADWHGAFEDTVASTDKTINSPGLSCMSPSPVLGTQPWRKSTAFVCPWLIQAEDGELQKNHFPCLRRLRDANFDILHILKILVLSCE